MTDKMIPVPRELLEKLLQDVAQNTIYSDIARKNYEAGKALLREAAQPDRCPLCKYDYGHSIGCANNPVDIELRRSNEENRMDAKRYRWLLNQCYRWPDGGRVCNEDDQSEDVAIWTKRKVGDDPCKAIDAAITAEKREGS